MSVRKMILPKIRNRDSPQKRISQQTIHQKLDEIMGILKNMKRVDKETTDRISMLESRVNALEAVNKGQLEMVNAHLTIASQYARTNPSRAIEELIMAVKLLLK